MPTSVRRPVIFSPRPRSLSSFSNASNAVYESSNQSRSSTTKTSRQSSPNVQPFDETSESTLKNQNKIFGCNKFFLIGLIIVLTLLFGSIVTLSVALPLLLTQTTKTTTTSITTTTTTTTTSTTTTASCTRPYVRASSGLCVNLFLDDNNCGSLGVLCTGSGVHCSAGVCSTVPTVQLTSYTSVLTGGVNGSIDDEVYNITLPFNISLYSTTTDQIQLTTNGVLCFSGCSDAYTAANLPSSSFSGITVFAYWDDLFVSSKTWQGIYYGSQGSTPNRILTFEYYLSHYDAPTNYTHFQIIFFENNPNTVRVSYFEVNSGGATATIGIQASGSGASIVYSYKQTNMITANMLLNFMTNVGTVSVG